MEGRKDKERRSIHSTVSGPVWLDRGQGVDGVKEELGREVQSQ